MDTGARTLTAVLGHESDPDLARALHALAHRDAVDELPVAEEDLPRRRLRATSRSGREYALALPRGSALVDGAVLELSPDGAVVVRSRSAGRLRLRASDPGAAVRLGFLAGHLHWVVDLGEAEHGRGELEVVLQAPVEDYLARVEDLLAAGRLAVVGP